MFITNNKFPSIILESVKNVELANKVNHTIKKEDGSVLGYIIKDDTNKVLNIYQNRPIDIGQLYVAVELNGWSDFAVVYKDGTELYVTDSTQKIEASADLPTMIGLKMIKLSNRFDTIKVRPRVPVLGGSIYLDGSKDDINNFEVYRDLLELNGLTSGIVKTADGEMKELTLDELNTAITEIKAFGLHLYQLKWTKEAEIMACTTVDEAKAIDISLI